MQREEVNSHAPNSPTGCRNSMPVTTLISLQSVIFSLFSTFHFYSFSSLSLSPLHFSFLSLSLEIPGQYKGVSKPQVTINHLNDFPLSFSFFIHLFLTLSSVFYSWSLNCTHTSRSLIPTCLSCSPFERQREFKFEFCFFIFIFVNSSSLSILSLLFLLFSIQFRAMMRRNIHFCWWEEVIFIKFVSFSIFIHFSLLINFSNCGFLLFFLLIAFLPKGSKNTAALLSHE